MSTWLELRPVIGWGAFKRSDELTAFLWSRLVPADWHYLNLASGTSAWEHRGVPEGMVFVGYEGKSVAELRVMGEAAAGIVHTLVDVFGLEQAEPA